MGGGIISVFYFAVISGLLLAWTGSILILKYGYKNNSALVSLIGGSGLLVTSCLLVYLIFKIGCGLILISDPKVVFQRTFGFYPAEDVSQLKSSYWYFADSGETYLSFKASSPTIDIIVSRMIQIKPKHFFELESDYKNNKKVLTWWAPERGGRILYYSSERGAGKKAPRDFASEEEILSYNPEKGTVCYRFTGSD